MGTKIHRSLTNSNGSQSQTKISISDKIARQLTSKKVHYFYYILELEALAVRKCKDIYLRIYKKNAFWTNLLPPWFPLPFLRYLFVETSILIHNTYTSEVCLQGWFLDLCGIGKWDNWIKGRIILNVSAIFMTLFTSYVHRSLLCHHSQLKSL